jgi:hypothetical protein
MKSAYPYEQDTIPRAPRLLADPRKNWKNDSAWWLYIAQTLSYSEKLRPMQIMHIILRPWPYKLPYFNGSWTRTRDLLFWASLLEIRRVVGSLIVLEAGALSHPPSACCKRVAALPSTQASHVAWAYSFKTLDVVSRMFWVAVKVESCTNVGFLQTVCRARIKVCIR